MLEPTPFQTQALAVPEAFNLALLGGRGGGKTTGLSLLILRHVAQYGPGARVLVVRQTYQGLLRIADELEQMLLSAFGAGVSHNRAEHLIRVPNGATVELGQIVHLSDLNVPAGVELVSLAHGSDLPVASIHMPRIREEAADGAAEEGAAE